MIRRRTFVATGVAALACPKIIRASNSPLFRIGVVADPQYADIDAKNTRFYRQSIGKLTEAVDYFNQQQLAWCVNLGDFIEKDWGSFDAIYKPIHDCKYRFYHVLGNHDFDVTANEKGQVPKRLGMERRYYTVETKSHLFAFLDTTDVSLYAQPKGAPEYEIAVSELKKYREAGTPGTKEWNGAVSDRQLRWFEETCKQAGTQGKKVIVFAHHPVFPTGDHNEWNASAILNIIRRNRNVVAWLNGHNHAGNFALESEVPFLTIHGMVETESSNAFALLEVFSDRLVVTGHGREPSREIVLRSI